MPMDETGWVTPKGSRELYYDRAIDWLPNGGRLTIERSGAAWSFGLDPVTATGGQYRLCWCAGTPENPLAHDRGYWTNRAGFTCSVPENFKVDVGEFLLVGPPTHAYERTCVVGQTCVLDDLHGVERGDLLMIMDTCGRSTVTGDARYYVDPSTEPVYSYLPEAGLAQLTEWHAGSDEAHFTANLTPGSDLTNLIYQPVRISSRGGLYRLCWCAKSYASNETQNASKPYQGQQLKFQCETPNHFKVDVGTLALLGPTGDMKLISGTAGVNRHDYDTRLDQLDRENVRLQRTCVSGQTCAFQGLVGHYLADTRIVVLDTCGEEIPVDRRPVG
jgi:hypothetical protein